jgi:hypothetical protein
MKEAAHLRKIAEEKFEKYGDEHTDEKPSPAVLLSMYPILRAVLWHYEAQALERGYLRGRAIAAHDVRLGLDEISLNGSVRFDSDTEPPPGWIVGKAEKLARGLP